MSRAVRIVQPFTGYPDGTDASEREFRADEVATDLPDAFADLIITKGHAVEAGAEPAAAPTEAEAEAKEHDA